MLYFCQSPLLSKLSISSSSQMADLITISLICALSANFLVRILIFEHFNYRDLLFSSPLFVLTQFSIRADNFVSGAMGKLETGVTTNQGVVGHLLKTASNVTNSAFCETLGPNFLNLFSKYNSCPKGSFAPHVLQSNEKFCELYENSDAQLKDCLSTSVVDVRININGYTDAIARVGKCCNICPVSIFSIDFLLLFRIT